MAPLPDARQFKQTTAALTSVATAASLQCKDLARTLHAAPTLLPDSNEEEDLKKDVDAISELSNEQDQKKKAFSEQLEEVKAKAHAYQKTQLLLPQASPMADLQPISEEGQYQRPMDELAKRLMLENAKLTRRMDEIETKLTRRMDELRPEVSTKLSQRVDELEGGVSVVIKDLMSLRRQVEAHLKEIEQRDDKELVKQLADAVQGLMSDLTLCRAAMDKKEVSIHQAPDHPEKRNAAIREEAGLAQTVPIRWISEQEVDHFDSSRARRCASPTRGHSPRRASPPVAARGLAAESEVTSGKRQMGVEQRVGPFTRSCTGFAQKLDGAQLIRDAAPSLQNLAASLQKPVAKERLQSPARDWAKMQSPGVPSRCFVPPRILPGSSPLPQWGTCRGSAPSKPNSGIVTPDASI